MAAALPAKASILIAYDNPTTGNTLQNFVGSLGLDFHVNGSIRIEALGAFNNGVLANLDGADHSSGVDVQIYRLTSPTTGTPVGPSIHLTSLSTVTQVNGDAFQSVTPFELDAGDYTIVTFNDTNYNLTEQPNTLTTLNDGNGLIAFIGTGRFDTGPFPSTVDNEVAPDGYFAGTFEYETPEPSAAAFLGVGLLGLAALRRRFR
jgi:hypothetical protein